MLEAGDAGGKLLFKQFRVNVSEIPSLQPKVSFGEWLKQWFGRKVLWYIWAIISAAVYLVIGLYLNDPAFIKITSSNLVNFFLYPVASILAFIVLAILFWAVYKLLEKIMIATRYSIPLSELAQVDDNASQLAVSRVMEIRDQLLNTMVQMQVVRENEVSYYRSTEICLTTLIDGVNQLEIRYNNRLSQQVVQSGFHGTGFHLGGQSMDSQGGPDGKKDLQASLAAPLLGRREGQVHEQDEEGAGEVEGEVAHSVNSLNSHQ